MWFHQIFPSKSHPLISSNENSLLINFKIVNLINKLYKINFNSLKIVWYWNFFLHKQIFCSSSNHFKKSHLTKWQFNSLIVTFFCPSTSSFVFFIYVIYFIHQWNIQLSLDSPGYLQGWPSINASSSCSRCKNFIFYFCIYLCIYHLHFQFICY